MDKAAVFRALHERIFVIPNPWDAGSARILASLGFGALATTSGGLAFTLGRPDGEGQIKRAETLAHAAVIVAATTLPVAADLENGFGDQPETVAETIRLAAGTGLVGGSVEDATGDLARPIYAFDFAVERVAAAVEAARETGFMLTVRAENFLYGRPDLDDTIRRLQAFERVGADVLFAPGLPDLEAIRTVCAAVGKPVNVIPGPGMTVATLAEVGVRRISVGSAFCRAGLGAFVRAAKEVAGEGSFEFMRDALPYAEANSYFRTLPSQRNPPLQSLGAPMAGTGEKPV